MEVSSGTQEKLNRLEKGLNSNQFHEQVEILAQAINFVEENPFPYFVNTVLVRLAKAFRSAASINGNGVRLRIVKLVEECQPYLNVVFSNDQIVNEVLYVSHSTDFKARCLMLMFLEKLASIIYDNKKVHHLLMESLESSYQLEVSAAIFASGALAQHSFEFASTVVEKLSGMVCLQQTDLSTKLRVINLMANFKENFEVTKKCMALSNRLLQENFDQKLSVAILSSLTCLAYRSCLGVTEQISLLFAQLYKAVPHRRLIQAILRCIQKLAEMSHHWSNAQISQLLDFIDHIHDMKSNLVLRSWLRCLEILTQTGIHSSVINEKLAPCWSLLQDSDLNVRVLAIKVFMNILMKLPSAQLHVMLLEALINTYTDLKTTSQVINKKKFYKILTNYLKTGICPENGTIRIISHLLETSPKIDDFELVLEALNAICDFDPEVCFIISEWAQTIIQQSDFVNKPPSLLLISLFLAPSELNETRAKILTDKVKGHVGNYTIYQIARTAFRNGHWKFVAAPLLNLIIDQTNSRETKDWLEALKYISNSQITTVTENDLVNSQSCLNSANLLLKKFINLDVCKQNFSFNYLYVHCLNSSYFVTTKVLGMINHFRFHLTAASEGMNVKESITKACDEQIRLIMEKSYPHWIKLYSRSFDADQQTLFHIQFWILYTQCLVTLLQVFCAVSIHPFQMVVNTELNTTNKQFESVIFWMKAQVDKFWEHAPPEIHLRITESSLKKFQELVEKFWSTPIYMPRYFFQNLNKTVIKLNLLPQPKEKDGSVSITAKRLPVTVEGMIQTNNPNRIESINVTLIAHLLKDSSERTMHIRTVELQENQTYFKAQFLLNLIKSTKIIVTITFDDANMKKTWECDSTAQLTVKVNE